MSAWYEAGNEPLQALREVVSLAGARRAAISFDEAMRQEATVCRVLELLAADRGAVIADDVGMGKTYEALAVAALALSRGRNKRVFVVTPRKEVRRKWEQDLEQFAGSNVVDGETRRLLELSLLVSHSSRGGDDAGEIEDQAQPEDGQDTKHWMFMERLLDDKDRRGIVFLHQHQLAPKNSSPAEYGFLVARALRAAGLRAKTVSRLVRKAKVPSPRDEMVWNWLLRAEEIGSGQALPKDLEQYIEEWRWDPIRMPVEPIHRKYRSHLLRCALGKADLLIVDEAHRLTAQGFQQAVRDVFAGVEKRLFLSATPFQVSVRDIDDIVEVLWDGRPPAALHGLGQKLEEFVSAKDHLDEKWNAVPDELVSAARKALDADAAPANALAAVKDIAAAWTAARSARDRAATALSSFVVRSVRKEKVLYRQLLLGDPTRPVQGRIDDDHLLERCTSGVPIPPHDVAVLATERLLQEICRGDDRTFVAQIRQNATSSYGALRRWLNEGLQHGEAGPRFADGSVGEAAPGDYARLLKRMLPPKDDRRIVHPKVHATARLAAEGALRLRKTLIFCGRRETAAELVERVNLMVDESVLARIRGERIDARDRLRRLRDGLLGDGLLSLAVRENPVRTILPRLVGLAEVPAECRQVDDELLAAANSAWRPDGLHAGELLHAVSHVVLRRLEACSPKRVEHRRGALSEGERATVDQFTYRRPEARSVARARRDDLARVLRFLLEGVDLYTPWAPMLRPMPHDERRLFERAVAAALAQPLICASVVPSVGGRWGANALEEVAAGLQHAVLPLDRGLERLVAGGAGSRKERLQRVWEVLAPRSPDAAASLDAEEEVSQRRRDGFNLPFGPYVVAATPRFGEGIDLHRECSCVVHHDAHWNPAVMEQRTGRIDRIHSRTARERCTLEVFIPFIKGSVDEQILHRAFERASWYDALLGGTNKATVQAQLDEALKEQTKAGDHEADGALRVVRRFPYDLARKLEIDLAPGTDGVVERQNLSALSSPYAPEDAEHASPLAAAARRILAGLEPAQVHVGHGPDGRLALECQAALIHSVHVDANVSEAVVTLKSSAGERKVSLKGGLLRERIVTALADLVSSTRPSEQLDARTMSRVG